jgi:O-antigen/teichoic acid export membrane protein
MINSRTARNTDLDGARIERSINRLFIALHVFSLALVIVLIFIGGPIALWIGVSYATALALTGIGFATTAHLKTKKLEDQNMALVKAIQALRYDIEQPRGRR